MEQTALEGGVVDKKVALLLLEDHDACDPKLDHLLSILSKHRANACWHKQGSFKHHLFGTWRVLYLWNQSTAIARCGLFHSAYSNSYVNLAIFKPDTERGVVKECVGDDAEQLIHLFCVVPRHDLIYTHLLPLYPENKIPAEGLELPHIRDKSTLIRLSPYLLKVCLTLTIADTCDQYFGWQDVMYDNHDGSFLFEGMNSTTLWPGDCRPGLWMSRLSHMGALALACEALEEQSEESRADKAKYGASPLPVVFNNCTTVLDKANETKARDLYWNVITQKTERSVQSEAQKDLEEAVSLNPFIAEPHVLLAQIALCKQVEGEEPDADAEAKQKRFATAEKHARRALVLFSEWGCSWDKRMSWEGWISWTRVLLGLALAQKPWPKSPFGVLGFGMVH